MGFFYEDRSRSEWADRMVETFLAFLVVRGRLALLTLVTSLLLSACGSEAPPPTTPTPLRTEVSSISIEQRVDVLKIREEQKLTATVTFRDGRTLGAGTFRYGRDDSYEVEARIVSVVKQ